MENGIQEVKYVSLWRTLKLYVPPGADGVATRLQLRTSNTLRSRTTVEDRQKGLAVRTIKEGSQGPIVCELAFCGGESRQTHAPELLLVIRRTRRSDGNQRSPDACDIPRRIGAYEWHALAIEILSKKLKAKSVDHTKCAAGGVGINTCLGLVGSTLPCSLAPPIARTSSRSHPLPNSHPAEGGSASA